jgi:hypothetical protein
MAAVGVANRHVVQRSPQRGHAAVSEAFEINGPCPALQISPQLDCKKIAFLSLRTQSQFACVNKSSPRPATRDIHLSRKMRSPGRLGSGTGASESSRMMPEISPAFLPPPYGANLCHPSWGRSARPGSPGVATPSGRRGFSFGMQPAPALVAAPPELRLGPPVAYFPLVRGPLKTGRHARRHRQTDRGGRSRPSGL